MSTHLNWNLEVEHDIKQAKKAFYAPRDLVPLTEADKVKLMQAGLIAYPDPAHAVNVALLQRRSYGSKH